MIREMICYFLKCIWLSAVVDTCERCCQKRLSCTRHRIDKTSGSGLGESSSRPDAQIGDGEEQCHLQIADINGKGKAVAKYVIFKASSRLDYLRKSTFSPAIFDDTHEYGTGNAGPDPFMNTWQHARLGPHIGCDYTWPYTGNRSLHSIFNSIP